MHIDVKKTGCESKSVAIASRLSFKEGLIVERLS